MPRFVSVFVIAAALACPSAFAQNTTSPAQAQQQQRMSTCNTEAGQRNLSGDARKSYMSACLGGKMNQTTLMKVCNNQATQDKLSSEARKTYLGTCLKKST
jgi:hypothetical protein